MVGDEERRREQPFRLMSRKVHFGPRGERCPTTGQLEAHTTHWRGRRWRVVYLGMFVQKAGAHSEEAGQTIAERGLPRNGEVGPGETYLIGRVA